MSFKLMDIEKHHYTISKDLGTRCAGWQEGHLDDVLLFYNFNNMNSCDHVKTLMMEANQF